ncbi:MAG: hypothetical protein E7612_02205 [Ruminococcaceae bacterium]|nr:hypothetical protein [Oscillospiraceae bacterium]
MIDGYFDVSRVRFYRKPAVSYRYRMLCVFLLVTYNRAFTFLVWNEFNIGSISINRDRVEGFA